MYLSSVFLCFVAKKQKAAYAVFEGKRGEGMETCIVVYDTISVVHRAKKLLKKKKIAARVVQLPSDLGLKGCSYGIECAAADLEGVLAYSAEKQLPVKALYRVEATENGRVYSAYDLS